MRDGWWALGLLLRGCVRGKSARSGATNDGVPNNGGAASVAAPTSGTTGLEGDSAGAGEPGVGAVPMAPVEAEWSEAAQRSLAPAEPRVGERQILRARAAQRPLAVREPYAVKPCASSATTAVLG